VVPHRATIKKANLKYVTSVFKFVVHKSSNSLSFLVQNFCSRSVHYSFFGGFLRQIKTDEELKVVNLFQI